MTVSNLSLFKRPNGFWYILFTVDGRRKWKSTRTGRKSEALKILRCFEDPPEAQPKSSKLSAFTDEFLTYARVNYARASRDIFIACLRNLLAIAGDRTLTTLEPRHVDLYKTQALQKKSPFTVNIELRSRHTTIRQPARLHSANLSISGTSRCEPHLLFEKGLATFPSFRAITSHRSHRYTALRFI